MNFNEWAETFDYDFSKFGHAGDSAQRSWDTCKNQILEILCKDCDKTQHNTDYLDVGTFCKKIKKAWQ